MRTPPPDDVAEIARRRLQALRQELIAAAPDQQPTDPDDLPAPPRVLPETGRHARTTLTTTQRLAAWCAERLPATLQGRVRLGSREAIVLVAILGLALAVAGCLALRSAGGTAEPVAATPASTTAQPLASAAPGTAAGQSDSATVVVDVAGKVRRPGVFTLPAGSRVIDALRKAGGARKKVDLTGLNLARVLADGEQVLVGVASGGGAAASAAASAGPPGTGGLVGLNTATLAQLDGLPGVGPVTAQKILDWRQAHGAFTSVDELLEVDGIGEKTLAELAPLVTL